MGMSWMEIGSFSLAALAVGAAAWAAVHAVLTKRDVRAAIGWVGLVLVFPLAGAVLYAVFGINRIGRRASALRGGRAAAAAVPEPPAGALPQGGADLAALARLVGRVVGLPLVAGNRVRALVDGEAAYPEMLAAIAAARRSLTLSTYIFDNDRAGREFRAALAAAVERGVEVRVIVDGVGARYSFPPTVHALRRDGVRTAVFLPTLIPWRLPWMNLRTHRKILVADGRVGFVGGMNLREEHRVRGDSAHPVHDLHFRVEGPVVAQIQGVFAADWEFAAGERLRGEPWFPPLAAVGDVCARAIPDGPDEDFDQMRWTLLGALAVARRRVRILTPYFLPDGDLLTALDVAALRGVEVDLVLPAANNLALVGWAMNAHLPPVLERGCRVWWTPPPFDHSKLLVVDGAWALVGSANWDPRSLRLNFELGVELYGLEAVAGLEALAERKIAAARPASLAELRDRPLPLRLRDGIARLAQPYL